MTKNSKMNDAQNQIDFAYFIYNNYVLKCIHRPIK